MTRRRPRTGGLPRRAQAGDLLAAAVLTAAIGSLVAAGTADAATTGTTIPVSMTIAPTCQASVTTMTFGTYASVQNDATATATIVCTRTTTYTIGLDSGLQHTGATYGANLAGPGASLLAYQIFQNAARTARWGGTQGLDVVGGTGNGANQMYTIYGRQPGGQFVRPGSYTDTITMTVNY